MSSSHRFPAQFSSQRSFIRSRWPARWLIACGVIGLAGISGCAAADDDNQARSEEYVKQTVVTRVDSASRDATAAAYWKVLLIGKQGADARPFVVVAAYADGDKALYEAVVKSEGNKTELEFRDVDGQPLSLKVEEGPSGQRRILRVRSLEVDLTALAADWSTIARLLGNEVEAAPAIRPQHGDHAETSPCATMSRSVLLSAIKALDVALVPEVTCTFGEVLSVGTAKVACIAAVGGASATGTANVREQWNGWDKTCSL